MIDVSGSLSSAVTELLCFRSGDARSSATAALVVGDTAFGVLGNPLLPACPTATPWLPLENDVGDTADPRTGAAALRVPTLVEERTADDVDVVGTTSGLPVNVIEFSPTTMAALVVVLLGPAAAASVSEGIERVKTEVIEEVDGGGAAPAERSTVLDDDWSIFF